MKVLLVSSANNGISPIVKAQGQSLQNVGIVVSNFGVKGKGLFGYISNLPRLRETTKKTNPQIIHAHYSFCGIISSLSTRKPVISSLMGSDIKSSRLWRIIVRVFVKYVWKATIVKSEDMKSSLRINSSRIHVIPNGVNLEAFRPLDKVDCRKKVGWEESKRIVLFAANPGRQEKNYELAQESFLKAELQNAELKVVFNVKHEDIPYYLCASDILLLTSKWEGSPNIIKEAMACGTPIVCTDVGDVRWLLDGVNGCFVTTHDPVDIASKLTLALQYAGKTNGRERLIELGLDSKNVAHRIVEVYDRVVKKRGP